MRILVVEDEKVLLGQLREELIGHGYIVDTASDGQEALYYGTEYDYDAVILDLGLPKLGGIELIKTWRAADRQFPMLILTARSSWQDKVEGLEVGGDDYVTKPFQIEELVARLNALIRRAAGFATPIIQEGSLLVDISKKEVRVEGREVQLTAYEYMVLECLILKPGRVISKSELTERLYEQDFDRDSNVIEVFVGRLRKKLSPLNPIKTIRGQGYKLQIEDLI